MDTRHVLAWDYHVFSVLEITVLKLTIPENPPTIGSFTLSSVQTREVKPFFKDTDLKRELGCKKYFGFDENLGV